MPDLDHLILEWRKIAATPGVSPETLDELETHLRETTERFVHSGMPLSAAFQRAVTDLGPMTTISSEFQKLAQPLWLPVQLVLGATALTALGALAMAIGVIGRSAFGAASLLLATHVFVVILGYTMTLLIGGLGICFVSQRAFDDFSTSRLRSLSRVSFVLSGAALVSTIVGVVLGMAWAKIAWGRYWAWDAKETGALCVMVWLGFYLVAHRFFQSSARGILTLSLLGNIVVSLAWFGPQLKGLEGHGVAGRSILLLAVAVNLGFFALGYCSPGGLRSKEA